MDVPRNASNLILLARLIDGTGQPISNITAGNAALVADSLKPGDSNYQPLALSAGTLGTFTANTWTPTAKPGLYQFCPANDLIVPGRKTYFTITYDGGQPTLGIINAIGGEGTGELLAEMEQRFGHGPWDTPDDYARDSDIESLAEQLSKWPTILPPQTRSVSDNKPIVFRWPESGKTITGQKRIDAGTFSAVAATITELPAEAGVPTYRLAYNAADRLTAEGTVTYWLTDGTHGHLLELRIESATAGGAGVGDRRIAARVTLNGAGVVGIAGVRLSIVGTSLVSLTNAFGFAEFNVPGNETYTLRITPPAGYQAIADRTIVVGGIDPPLEEIAASTAAATIGPAGTCVLSFRVASQSDLSKEGVIAIAKLPKGFTIKNETIGLNFVEEGTSDASGNISLTLMPDQDYELSVQRPGHTAVKLKIKTPNSDTATLPQVIEV